MTLPRLVKLYLYQYENKPNGLGPELASKIFNLRQLGYETFFERKIIEGCTLIYSAYMYFNTEEEAALFKLTYL